MFEDKSELFGVVTEDPLSNFKKGDHFQITTWTFPPAAFMLPMPWDCFKGVLLKLSFGDRSQSRVTGSAVMVAPGVAITAAHVLVPELEALMAGKAAGYALALNDGAVDIWAIRHLTIQRHTDLALLGLERASALPDAPLAHAVIAPSLPTVGAPVLIAGFSASETQFEVSEKGPSVVGGMRAALGVVTEHYPEGRDRVMLPWPCFEVRASSWGGMSGGPVFNEDGQLVGILSTSLSVLADDAEGPSFISAIAPILTQPFRASWPKGFYKEGATLIGIDRAACAIID